MTLRAKALCALVLASCARTPPPPLPAPADPCALGGSGNGRDTVRVALGGPVAADHAPVPTNDAERIVFRQLYETLVRVDCAGVVRPGLATRWQSDAGDTRWTFTLRPGATFWDGTPVDAAALSASWRRDTTLPLRDVRATDARTVVVSLVAARPITSFGDPAWSVVKRIAESAWPVGTGAVWVREWTGTGPDSLLRALPTPAAPPGTPVLEFRAAIGADPRDLLDGDADALVVRDPAVERYAAGRGDWRVVPLPWDRVQVLLSPARVAAGVTTQLDRQDRLALARDAVRADARVPEEPAWWSARSCGAHPAVPRSGPLAPRVVFLRGDAVARDLADRLVARADLEVATVLGATTPLALRTASLDSAAFAVALAAGRDLAFILSLASAPPDPCRAVEALLARAPWLADPDGALPPSAIVPLVETRGALLLRGAIVVHADRDGGIRLTPLPDGSRR
jgi:hypothetical protein